MREQFIQSTRALADVHDLHEHRQEVAALFHRLRNRSSGGDLIAHIVDHAFHRTIAERSLGDFQRLNDRDTRHRQRRQGPGESCDGRIFDEASHDRQAEQRQVDLHSAGGIFVIHGDADDRHHHCGNRDEPVISQHMGDAEHDLRRQRHVELVARKWLEQRGNDECHHHDDRADDQYEQDRRIHHGARDRTTQFQILVEQFRGLRQHFVELSGDFAGPREIHKQFGERLSPALHRIAERFALLHFANKIVDHLALSR